MNSTLKAKHIVMAMLLILLAVVFVVEWRYSQDMRQHIGLVNRKLETVRQRAASPRGQVDSVQATSAVADAGAEIIATHDHVHTLKDEYLAWKIKKAVEKSITVGDANEDAIAKWPASL